MGEKQEWYPCAMQPPSNASMFPHSANREFDRFETASHFFRFASLPFVLMLLPRQTYKWFREFIAKKNHETFSALIQETIFIGRCFRRNKSTLFNREREKNYQLLPNDNNSWIWKNRIQFSWRSRWIVAAISHRLITDIRFELVLKNIDRLRFAIMTPAWKTKRILKSPLC